MHRLPERSLPRRLGPLVLLTLLLSCLSTLSPVASQAREVRVAVRADEVTTSLSLRRVGVVELDLAAQHVAAYWRGHRHAQVSLSFSEDGDDWSEPVDAGRDEAGEQRSNGVTYGALLDAGDARWVRVRSDRPITQLTVLGMRDGETASTTPARTTSGAVATAATTQPPVRSRAEWGADESLRDGRPSFARVKKLVVHHTATSNSYTDRAGAQSQIRAILRYHTVTQGWSDIGYNFLIDKFGTIYEGRWSRSYVGVDPSGDNAAGEGVVGAHTLNWNTGSVGVAMLGTYSERDISNAARSSLTKLLAWEAARNGINPTARQAYTNPSSGDTITTYNIAGHRNYKATECPGGDFYATLPALRQAVAAQMAVPDGDTVAPSTPTGLTGSARRHRVLLSWQAATDDSGADPRYRVLRSFSGRAGTFTRVGATSATSYTDTGLKRRRLHHYRVKALDQAGNLSAPSDVLTIRTR